MPPTRLKVNIGDHEAGPGHKGEEKGTEVNSKDPALTNLPVVDSRDFVPRGKVPFNQNCNPPLFPLARVAAEGQTIFVDALKRVVIKELELGFLK